MLYYKILGSDACEVQPEPLTSASADLRLDAPRPDAAATAVGRTPESRASVLELLDDVSCRAHLQQSSEGILHYRSGRGDTALAVAYTVGEDRVVIPILRVSSATPYVEGAELMLEVARRTGRDDRRVVRATGRASRIRWPVDSGRVGPTSTPAPVYGELTLLDVRLRGFVQSTITRSPSSPDEAVGP